MPKPYFQQNYKIDSIIRVDHAGEFGAVKIYEGQLAFSKDTSTSLVIKEMKAQEQQHLGYFTEKMYKCQVNSTVMLPLWSIGGYYLGYISMLLGNKYAMLLTDTVEEVITEHYEQQINFLSQPAYSSHQDDLLKNIKQFRQDESEHQHIARDFIVNNTILDLPYKFIIRNICKLAIAISKKV